MNDREKKLIIILFGAAFIIVNVFLYTEYQTKMAKNKAVYQSNQDELERMKSELLDADSLSDDMAWLAENPPKEGEHGQIGSELATYVEKAALKNGIKIKNRPSPEPENFDEDGPFRTAVISARGNAQDNALYRWLIEIQSPNDHRSITNLRLLPQRDDDTRIDCEVEITQWFTPAEEEIEVSSN